MQTNQANNILDLPIHDKKLRFADVFAGCGGLSLGLMQAGWEGCFAVEKDQNAFQTLKRNLMHPSAKLRFKWPDWLSEEAIGIGSFLEKYRANLENISGEIDMLVGGPPCQGFSAAGRRNPSDPRNQLVRLYLELVYILKPKVVLIENVRGITADFVSTEVDSDQINYANWIKSELERKYIVSSRVLDTSDFGVPQRRSRYFILGFLKGSTLSGVDPFKAIENDRLLFLRQKGIPVVPVSAQMAISDLELRRNGKIPSRDTTGFEDISYNGPLNSFQKIMNLDHVGVPSDTRLARHSPEIVARFSRIIKLCQAEGRLNVSLSPEQRASFGLKKRAIRVLDPDSPSPTITSMPDDLIHYSEPRAMTVRENARLQSFPDWFVFRGNYTTGGKRRQKEVPRFTQVANAVPPLVAESIGLSIQKILQEEALPNS